MIAPTAIVTDIDGEDFDTGSLTVSFTSGGHAQDRLNIRSIGNGIGEVNVSGTNVLYQGVIVGTYSSVFVASFILSKLGVKRDWDKIDDGRAGTQFANIDA